ncbi:MAG: ribonuclease HI [Planctomycetota bacterium]|jgi:ribonuclease HI
MPRSRPHVELYTDGACSGNPGPGGWAYILKHPESGRVRERWGGERRTTNNRMELISVIRGLGTLDQPSRVDLYSDSQYVCRGVNEWLDQWKAKGWKRGKNASIKNLELWKQIDKLRQLHEVRCHWIRGHDRHPENERCDRLAVAASERAGV